MKESVKYGAELVSDEIFPVGIIKRRRLVREYTQAIFIAVVLGLFIRMVVVQAFKIPSGSMIPTLLVGDYVLVNKLIYGIKIPFLDKSLVEVSEPKRGEVIVFKYPRDTSKHYIKRVIGLPGDRIQISNRRLLVNGRLAEDSHAFHSSSENRFESILDNFGPVTVPSHHLFVMGDNREASSDSRVWGFVPLSYVSGKVFLIYWSWDHRRLSVRWSRLGNLVD